MTGRTYWVRVLTPYAHRGFRRGWLTDLEVVLLDEAGTEAHLPRPSGWARADLLVRELEGDVTDPDDPARRGIVYSMRAPTGDRMELSV